MGGICIWVTGKCPGEIRSDYKCPIPIFLKCCVKSGDGVVDPGTQVGDDEYTGPGLVEEIRDDKPITILTVDTNKPKTCSELCISKGHKSGECKTSPCTSGTIDLGESNCLQTGSTNQRCCCTPMPCIDMGGECKSTSECGECGGTMIDGGYCASGICCDCPGQDTEFIEEELSEGEQVTDDEVTAHIDSPKDGATYVQNKPVVFTGSGVRGETKLTDLTWESSLDDFLGNEESFEKELSAGKHTITLTVKDDTGKQATDTVTITVPILCSVSDYCQSYASSAENCGIMRVQLNTGDQRSDSATYSDYTENVFTALHRGETYTIHFLGGTTGRIDSDEDDWNGITATVWLDFNQNKIFDIPRWQAEAIYLGDWYIETEGKYFTYQSDKEFTVPKDAKLGTTLMRVVTSANFWADPCETDFVGETEDYIVDIREPEIIDITPPEIFNPQPSGTTPVPTIFLSVETDEDATCKYDASDKDYRVMENTFANTGERYHSSKIGPLADGIHTYYVKCKDHVGKQRYMSGNENEDPFLIIFTISAERPEVLVAPPDWKIVFSLLPIAVKENYPLLIHAEGEDEETKRDYVAHFIEDLGVKKVVSFTQEYTGENVEQVDADTFIEDYWMSRNPDTGIYDDSKKSGIFSAWYAAWKGIPFSTDEELLNRINPGMTIEKHVTQDQATQEFIDQVNPNPPIVVVTDPDDPNAVLAPIYAAYKNGVIIFTQGGDCSAIEENIQSQLEGLKTKGLNINLDKVEGHYQMGGQYTYDRRDQYLVYVANADHIPLQQNNGNCNWPGICSCDQSISSMRFGFGRIGRFVNTESDLSISSVLMMRGIFYHITPKNNLAVFWGEFESKPCMWTNGCFGSYAEYVNIDRPKFSKYFDTISFIATTRTGDAVERADIFMNYAHGGLLVKPLYAGRRYHSTIILNFGCSCERTYYFFIDGAAAYVGTTKTIGWLDFDYNEFANGQSIGQCPSLKNDVLIYGDPTIRIKKGSGEESVIYGIDMDPSSHSQTPIKSVKYKPYVDTTKITVSNCLWSSEQGSIVIQGCPPAKAGEEKECVFGDVSEYDELCCLKLTAYADYNGYEIPIVRSTNICGVGRDHCSDGCH